jgi:ubiquinone/menaquinone biosynthesis C-methylase UbiE
VKKDDQMSMPQDDAGEPAISSIVKRWWERHARSYQELCHIPIDVHYGPGSPNEDYLQLLGPVAGKHVLELGCGGAQCAIAFAKQGAIVIGVDIAAAQLACARQLAEQNKVALDLYQRDMTDLAPIPTSSQDVAFSAHAFGYVDDLLSCFKEVRRVLKDDGIFVWSIGHPFYELADPQTLQLQRSYFDTGALVEEQETGSFFAEVHRTLGELVDLLVKAGFVVEKIIEPDSRQRYPYDPWYGLWGLYLPKLLQKVPATIIFKCRKS